jgi:hypothetical protein
MKRVLRDINKLREETADAVRLALETSLGKVRHDEKAYPIREKPDMLKFEDDDENNQRSVR